MHAVLITAYKDFTLLERLVRRLDRAFFEIFIHIDARSSISAAQAAQLTAMGCTVFRKHRIRWGAISHLHAIFDLLKMAAEHDFDYVHVISGQDYPLATAEDFVARCDGRIFMSYEPLEDTAADVRDRYRRYDIFYFLLAGPPLTGTLYQYANRLSLWMQQRLGIERGSLPPYDKLYKGIVWMSFPMAAGRWLLDDPMPQQFLRTVRTSYVAEEIVFQTAFLNSPMASRVVDDDLRFTDWTFRNGSVPAYLDASDVDKALAAKALFARKVDTMISEDFLRSVDEAVFSGRADKRTKKPASIPQDP